MGCNRKIVPFGGSFVIAAAVYIVGALLPNWVQVKNEFLEAHEGLFLTCPTPGYSYCIGVSPGDWMIHVWAAAAGLVLSITAMILILVWTVGSKQSVGIAGKSLGLFAGICGLVSVIYYVVLTKQAPSGSAYYITVAGAIWLSLQSAIGLCARSSDPKQGNQPMTYVVQYVNPGVQQGQQYVNQGVQQGQQYVNQGVQPGQQYLDQGVQPGPQYLNQGVQPGPQYFNQEVQSGQQDVNPEVQPGQQNVNPEVQPGQQNVNPEVQPGQQDVNPEVQTGQQYSCGKTHGIQTYCTHL